MHVKQRILTDTGVEYSQPAQAVMRYQGDGHDHWHMDQINARPAVGGASILQVILPWLVTPGHGALRIASL